MSRFLTAFASIGLAAITALPALAQSPLSLSGMSVYRYETLVDHSGNSGSFCCAPYVLGGPDGHFFYIRAIFDVAWSDDLDRISYSSSDITLMLPGDEEGRRAQGRYDWYGVFTPSAGSMSERRPRDFPEETAQAFLNGVWYLPREATTATLIIGEDDDMLEIPVNLAVEVGPVISPSQTFSFVPTGLTRATELTAETNMNRTDVPGLLAPATGTMLRVDFDATPAFSTDTDAQAGENQAFLRNTWFSLVGPDGAPLTLIGSQSGSNSTPRIEWTNSISWDSNPRTVDMSLYFLGDGAPGTYQLYFLEDMVGEITLQ
ncbi:hypothetical protein [Nioella sediminis]|jgi:hypothetical protein|uniref:hypothetical protein n=1 Tax=Nioella sediminis TaxID=1912092 RepID=UPI0008FD88CC|nr:hypothetical protein [Nioella sediminis]TBX27681.1 hypothetical protein TK43_09825 [Roseovarius sp. JS7-11]